MQLKSVASGIAAATRDGGRVYGLGPLGHLFAVRLDDGEEFFAHRDFGAKAPGHGFTSTPTIVGWQPP